MVMRDDFTRLRFSPQASAVCVDFVEISKGSAIIPLLFDNVGRFQSGQMGRTVNPLALPSGVRIPTRRFRQSYSSTDCFGVFEEEFMDLDDRGSLVV